MKPVDSHIAWPDDQRQALFDRWIAAQAAAFELQLSSLAPASADASFRRYFRIQGERGTFIVMDAPPPQEDVRPFVDVASRIHAAGLEAPEVLAADVEHGFLLMSDLGSTLYLAALQDAQAADQAAASAAYAFAPEFAGGVRCDALMRPVLAALAQWQQRVDATGLPAYDEAMLARELALFPEWCVAREFGVTWTPAQQQIWQALCRTLIDSALNQPKLAVHRDWMPRNLMLTPAGPGILDFQDAALGPVTYDIASLLRDAFISWDEAQELDWAVRWWQQARATGLLAGHAMADDFGECWRAVEWMGLQRHLKVLGIFCRLKHRDGKPAYSADLPRFFAYATRVALRYRELKPLVGLLEPLTGPLTTTGFSMR